MQVIPVILVIPGPGHLGHPGSRSSRGSRQFPGGALVTCMSNVDVTCQWCLCRVAPHSPTRREGDGSELALPPSWMVLRGGCWCVAHCRAGSCVLYSCRCVGPRTLVTFCEARSMVGLTELAALRTALLAALIMLQHTQSTKLESQGARKPATTTTGGGPRRPLCPGQMQKRGRLYNV